MLKIRLIIDRDNTTYKFYSDSRGYFVQEDNFGKESMLLSGISSEFDGLCDEKGTLHFLLQSAVGELIYLRFDGSYWKKYSIFKSKDNSAKISGIKLMYSHGLLCGFYAMEHRDRILMVKHCFSVESLYTTPEVAALLDIRKSYCICSGSRGEIHLFYRDMEGVYRENVYGSDFRRIKENLILFEDDIYSLDACSTSSGFIYTYTASRKGYTALIFKKDSESEKIITFGIAKNTPVSVGMNDGNIEIIWIEGRNRLKAVSRDGGMHFSKPKIDSGNADFEIIKHGGSTANYGNTKISRTGIMKGEPKMNSLKPNTHDGIRADIGASEFMQYLRDIEKEVDKIGKNTEKICNFLETLVSFRKNADNPSFVTEDTNDFASEVSDADIGDRNEENIKLFESMNIDEVLPAGNEKA